MKKILLYYHFNRIRGGGDFLPLSFLEELSRTCNVTLAMDVKKDIEEIAKMYGFSFDTRSIKVETVMPEGYNWQNHTLSHSLHRVRRLKKLAADADVCISAANIIDFGRPAHYFINCIDFGDEGFLDYAYHKKMRFARKCRSFAIDGLKCLLGVRPRRSILKDQRESVYPNSEFVNHLMRSYYPPFKGQVFYPPTLFEPGNTVSERDPLKIVYLGRAFFQKKLPDIIEIVQLARAVSGLDFRLSLAGFLMSAESKNALCSHVEEKNWIDFPGELYGENKKEFLLSATYAIHTMREEAFGISITEYMKAGLIPIVPDEGGACEVVDTPELSFHSKEDAARILVRLLTDPGFRETQRRRCADRVRIFSRDAYLERQHNILKDIIGE